MGKGLLFLLFSIQISIVSAKFLSNQGIFKGTLILKTDKMIQVKTSDGIVYLLEPEEILTDLKGAILGKEVQFIKQIDLTQETALDIDFDSVSRMGDKQLLKLRKVYLDFFERIDSKLVPRGDAKKYSSVFNKGMNFFIDAANAKKKKNNLVIGYVGGWPTGCSYWYCGAPHYGYYRKFARSKGYSKELTYTSDHRCGAGFFRCNPLFFGNYDPSQDPKSSLVVGKSGKKGICIKFPTGRRRYQMLTKRCREASESLGENHLKRLKERVRSKQWQKGFAKTIRGVHDWCYKVKKNPKFKKDPCADLRTQIAKIKALPKGQSLKKAIARRCPIGFPSPGMKLIECNGKKSCLNIFEFRCNFSIGKTRMAALCDCSKFPPESNGSISYQDCIASYKQGMQIDPGQSRYKIPKTQKARRL